jgi:hypothetical protein
MPVENKKQTVIEIRYVMDDGTGYGRVVTGFESHYAHCPKAGEFRRGFGGRAKFHQKKQKRVVRDPGGSR